MVATKHPCKARRVSWLPEALIYSREGSPVVVLCKLLAKSHWLQLALACEGSAFLVEMLAGLSRNENVIRMLGYHRIIARLGEKKLRLCF